ncbi:MAG TPA: hypothetical protein VEA16_04825 [Vicinamibacterales bacterium]|nr:hypothetical protein [Vicinamibacterales bacterium]
MSAADLAHAMRLALEPVCDRLDRQIKLLERIALQLSFVEAADAPAEPGCPHPEDARADFSQPGVVEWECRQCRHHYGPEYIGAEVPA